MLIAHNGKNLDILISSKAAENCNLYVVFTHCVAAFVDSLAFPGVEKCLTNLTWLSIFAMKVTIRTMLWMILICSANKRPNRRLCSPEKPVKSNEYIGAKLWYIYYMFGPVVQ